MKHCLNLMPAKMRDEAGPLFRRCQEHVEHVERLFAVARHMRKPRADLLYPVGETRIIPVP